MGIIWRFTMVLLSTLAAFVIIVHTAEDDIELTYRRDLQSRHLYNGTPQYEQTWRVSEVDSTVQLPRDTWNNNSPEEPPKRQRPGRMRKRRPQQQNPTEDIITQERYTYPEGPPQAYIETDVSEQVSETPKRRRKKLDQTPNEWQSETSERPLRRRGRRRKKPSSSTWPEVSEFNVPQPEEIRLGAILDPSEVTDERIYTDTEGIRQLIEQNQSGNDEPEIKTDRTLIDFRQQKMKDGLIVHEFEEPLTQLAATKEDKSLSEFTLELPDTSKYPKSGGSIYNETDNFQEKIMDKTFEAVSTFNKAENKRPMDPVTLKDILKRSNGTSLSEILQKHNLSLADLLSGRENVISILNSEDSNETSVPRIVESEVQHRESNKVANNYKSINKQKTETSEESIFLNLESKHGATRLVLENNIKTETAQSNFQEQMKNEKISSFDTTVDPGITQKLVTRKRLPGSRRRLRMRPMMNSTYKSQLSRDLIALSPRQQINYLQKNSSKPAELNEVGILLNTNNTKQLTFNEKRNIPRNFNGDITTISIVTNEPFSDISSSQTFVSKDARQESIHTETPITITSIAMAKTPEPPFKIREKQFVTPVVRHPVNSSTLRQQAFNNRLKRKRLKHKNITTESPQDKVLNHLNGVSDIVSSTELIERTRPPKLDENKPVTTSLVGYLTSNISKAFNNVTKDRLSNQGRTSSTTKRPTTSSTTEESARFEIEEIFNDIGTSPRLSRILKERNMTLSELVEHRERGSSNIHLADIFHNTSKEPNPPVPFLSKSLIEPISKETYPLRALLEANLHETTGKLATLNPGRSNVNIPIVMDFGNNVNENAENMGILSLFSNLTNHGDITYKNVKQNSEGGVNQPTTATYEKNGNTTREGKMMNNINNQDDIVSWNEIFTLMRKTYKNETGTIPETLKEDPKSVDIFPKLPLDEDIDGNGLIILEDLQHLKEYDSKVASAGHEKVEIKTYKRIEAVTEVTGTLDKIPSQTKSVTVATACIAGLAIVLFLLTYAAFKWKQDKNSIQKCDVEGENIPSPIFENRKSYKNNNSIRSISPMLSTSNIYTRNTLDSRTGKESPEYMWDSLRKPFQ